MTIIKGIILIIVFTLIMGCVGYEYSQDYSTNTSESRENLDFELETVSYPYEKSSELQIDKPMEIIIAPEITENYDLPIAVNIEGFLVSQTNLNITNYRSTIEKELTKAIGQNFEVIIKDEFNESGLQLILEKAEYDEKASSITYSAKLNYDGSTYAKITGTTGWADIGPSEISFSNEAEWIEGEKSLAKPKIELSIVYLAEAIYSNITDNYELDNINFWEFPFLSEDTTINDILFKKGTVVTYYDSGELKKALIQEPVTLEGIQYTNGVIYLEENGYVGEDGIFFYPSGNLKAAELIDDTVINGYKTAGGSLVEFYKSGNLKEAYLLENYTVDGIEYTVDEDYYHSSMFDESGKVLGGTLLNDTKFGKYKYSGLSYIDFFENGTVSWGTLVDEVKIGSYTFNYDIGFYKSGKISDGYLVNPTRIEGILIDHYNMVSFYENGKLMSGVTAEDTTIQETLFKAEEYFYFNKKGELDEDPYGYK